MSNINGSLEITIVTMTTQLQKLFGILLLLFFYTSQIIAQCGENGHSTNERDSWLSCQTSNAPNSLASNNYHWIYYNLGYIYSLDAITIWNYNVANGTDKGVKDAEIFYSEDGENWTSGGLFQIPEADGQVDYEGWQGIDLNGVAARFITITAYSNWGSSDCTGLSEVRFNIGEQITSIHEKEISNSEMLVFPNPTNQVLSIRLKNNERIKELIIVDAAGHEILRRKEPTTTFTLDVASFQNGMYYLKVWTAKQIWLVNKFVKID